MFRYLNKKCITLEKFTAKRIRIRNMYFKTGK